MMIRCWEVWDKEVRFFLNYFVM